MTVIKILPHSLSSKAGSKVKNLNFAKPKSFLDTCIFTEISHADRGTINIKHNNCDFRSKAWVQPPGWTYGWSQKVKFQFFQCMVMLRIKVNGSTNAATWCKYFSRRTPTPLPPDPGCQKVKLIFSQNMVMLHIKLNGVTQIPSQPWGWGQIIKIQLFQNMVRLHFKFMESRMQLRGSKLFAHRHPPNHPHSPPWGWGQKVKIQLFQNMGMSHIILKGITNAATW